MNLLSENKFIYKIILFFIVLFVLFYRIHDKVDYYFPAIISILNIGLIIFFLLRKQFKSIIYYIYFIYGFLTLKLPMLYFLVRYDVKQVNGFYRFHLVTPEELVSVNSYIFLFDILVMLFLFFFHGPKTKIRKINILPYSRELIKINNYTIIIFLFIVSILSKLYLISTGIWFFYEMNDINIANYNFAGLFTILEKLDLLILLFFVFKQKIKTISKKDYAFFYLVLSISLYFAFLSTSKGKVITLFFPVILFFIYKNKIKKTIFIVLAITLFINGFFNYMMFLRYENHLTLTEATSKYFTKDEINYTRKAKLIGEDKLITRLEYQTVIAKTFRTYKNNTPKEKYAYEQNIFGLIPRIIWKDKPDLGIDTNRLGREMDILYRRDFYTTIGLTPLGIAFYFYKFKGVFLIAFFTSIILYFNLKLLNENKWLGFLLSFIIGMQIARNGTFLNIIPDLVRTYIIFTCAGLLLNNKNLNK